MALRIQSRDDSGATKGKCCNCRKKGHYIRDCWAPGGGKEGQTPSWYKPKNEAAKQADEDVFAFIVNEISYISTSVTDWLAVRVPIFPIVVCVRSAYVIGARVGFRVESGAVALLQLDL